jgi:putative polyhydroxyalkanoate system protein
MPKIEFSQNHSLDAGELKKRLDGMSKELSDKYEIKSKWVSDTKAEVSRSGVTGSINIEPTKVTVALDLSFMMSPLKGTIEEKLRAKLGDICKS